jgi:hypothetical protein
MNNKLMVKVEKRATADNEFSQATSILSRRRTVDWPDEFVQVHK